jgi:hypothetical protein
VLKIRPPLVFQHEHADLFLQALDEVLASALRRTGRARNPSAKLAARRACVIACADAYERAFVRAPDSTNKTEDQRTYSVSVPDAWLLREPDVLPSVTAAVRRGAMSLIFPTGGLSSASSGPGTGYCPEGRWRGRRWP